MSGSSPAQRKAFENATAYVVSTENRFEKERFVRDFLRFAGRVIRQNGGGSEGRGRNYRYGDWHGSSKLVPVETAEGSPQMSAGINGTVIEFSKRRLGREKVLLREVATASVSVGVAATDHGFGPNYFAASEPILTVIAQPPTVLYQYEDGPLAPIQAGTPAWDEMKGFTDMLRAQEEALSYGQAKPTGWDVK